MFKSNHFHSIYYYYDYLAQFASYSSAFSRKNFMNLSYNISFILSYKDSQNLITSQQYQINRRQFNTQHYNTIIRVQHRPVKISIMSQSSLLDQIKRIKSTIKPVSKRAIKHQQEQRLQKALSQAQALRLKASVQRQKTKNSETQDDQLSICSNSSSGLNAKRLFQSHGSASKEKNRDKSKDQQSNLGYSYEGASFCFGVRDVQLTIKRVQIFQKIIQKRGGIVYSIQQAHQKGVNYVLSTKNISKHTLLQKLSQQKGTQKHQIAFKKILNYNFIVDCQRQSRLLDTDLYDLFKQKQRQENKLTGNQKQVNLVTSNKKWDSSSQPQDQLGRTRKLIHIEEEVTDDQLDQINQTIKIKTTHKTKSLNYFNNSKKKAQIDKQKFACQNGSSSSQFSINQYIYQQLMKFYNIYQNQKDLGRKIAYLKAASAIKSYHKQIQSQKDIMNLRGIGKKIIDKVKQLLQTGQIQKLQKLQQSQQTLACQQLTRVWGIGASKAKQLYLKGIHSLEQLSLRQDLLNKNQRIGLKYVHQFEERIPREKVKGMFEVVRTCIRQICGQEMLYDVEVCGSYRRGKQTCGDIDIIITRKDGIYQPNILIDLINRLQKQKFLTDHLSIPSASPQHPKPVSYMGVCVYESPTHHRIDIKYYPLEQYPFALLYFTGSDMFNRSMRLYARKMGYSLSDRGLVPVERGAGNTKVWAGGRIGLAGEREIFELLGLDWKQPWERNI